MSTGKVVTFTERQRSLRWPTVGVCTFLAVLFALWVGYSLPSVPQPQIYASHSGTR